MSSAAKSGGGNKFTPVPDSGTGDLNQEATRMKLSGFSLRLGKHGRVYFRTGGASKSTPRASAPQAPAAPQPVYRNPYTLWGMMWRICLAAVFAMNIYAAYIYGEFPRFLYSCAMCAAMIFFSVRYCLRYHRAATAPIQAAQDSADAQTGTAAHTLATVAGSPAKKDPEQDLSLIHI